ncbi:MAG: PIN domain-containing protein [Planctomycetes bacterium]|nr:PIN domain-containing protein [Planctomycetota bacterium]
MTQHILLDTGPLVAYLNQHDPNHDWARLQWQNLQPPMLTCEAVISESCHLLRRTRHGVLNVFEMMRRAVIRVAYHLEDEIAPVGMLLKRYNDVPMSLADACLVRMAEMYSESTVLTMDSDFRHYRKNRRQVIPLLIPSERK